MLLRMLFRVSGRTKTFVALRSPRCLNTRAISLFRSIQIVVRQSSVCSGWPRGLLQVNTGHLIGLFRRRFKRQRVRAALPAIGQRWTAGPVMITGRTRMNQNNFKQKNPEKLIKNIVKNGIYFAKLSIFSRKRIRTFRPKSMRKCCVWHHSSALDAL